VEKRRRESEERVGHEREGLRSFRSEAMGVPPHCDITSKLLSNRSGSVWYGLLDQSGAFDCWTKCLMYG
jgi:hypothetical protein